MDQDLLTILNTFFWEVSAAAFFFKISMLFRHPTEPAV